MAGEGDGKAEFERVYGNVGLILDAVARPRVHRGGWRIEKEVGRDNVEEYVVIGGWDSIEAARGAANHKDFGTYDAALKSVTSGREVKHYKRLL